jgi:Spy/CpxP family protein refolding chaperone
MTTDQLARFRVEHARFIEQLQEPDQEIKSKQVELIDLLGAPSPDHQAIVKKHEEIQHLQGAVQGRIIDHFLRASTLLTAEQRTRFFELIKTRMATNAQVCPPWMRPLEHGNTREK